LYPLAPADVFQFAVNDVPVTDVAAVATGSKTMERELNVPLFSIVPSLFDAATADPDPTERFDPLPMVMVL
jgi:hypothetical protein